MGENDFKDLPGSPEKVSSTAKLVASNAAHLARLLQQTNYPGVPSH
jgi:hypothetical protein